MNFIIVAVQPEVNAFDGVLFGANPHGIHLAAGPDRMHLMLEGLGQAILGWVTIVLSKAGMHMKVLVQVTCNIFALGRLPAVNRYISTLPCKTSDPTMEY